MCILISYQLPGTKKALDLAVITLTLVVQSQTQANPGMDRGMQLLLTLLSGVTLVQELCKSSWSVTMKINDAGVIKCTLFTQAKYSSLPT